ncbi:phthiocerol/phthiodiolone dimycocerosyl transferase family protein [Nocardia tengchongensis]|uniref:phthiocerol/phthiodiolone dimycocerosyl transferase family protein n=1 Tax=Nocardia tengchongensis TaxID=2055889 RepID=UPI0036924BC2
MTAQRPLSPFESGYFAADARLGSVPIGGMSLFIGSAVRGEVDAGILRRVLTELADGHVLLRSRVHTVNGVARFVAEEPVTPPLSVRAGGVDEYWDLVNSPQDWDAGLFRAVLLRGTRENRVVLVIHHGIGDGRSAFALLDEMWRRYTAHAAGTALPPHDSDRELIGGVDELLARTVTDAQVDGFLAQLGQEIAVASPQDAPRTLPHDGDGIGDPGGRLALRRIELSPRHTAELVDVARGRGISVNSVLAGAALAAVRGEIAGDGPIPLMCGHAADLRPETSPRLAVSAILNCASGAGTPAPVDRDADPLAVGAIVDATMRVMLETRFPALFMRAAQRRLEPQLAAMLSQPPAIALSNMGRLPAHPMPRSLEFVRDEVFAMAAGMPPKMTIFTVGGRLTVQVEYDTAEHSHTRMGRIAEAMSDRLARVTHVAARG